MRVATLPTASPEATRVRYVKISGSMGVLIIRGIIRRTNSPNAAVRTAKAGRTRNVVRRMPAARMPRWAAAPATAPQAVATIPYVPANSTVPTTIPAVYRIGARAYGRNRRSATRISPRQMDTANMTWAKQLIRRSWT